MAGEDGRRVVDDLGCDITDRVISQFGSVDEFEQLCVAYDRLVARYEALLDSDG